MTKWAFCSRCGRYTPLHFTGTICGGGILEESYRNACFLCKKDVHLSVVVGISEEALKHFSEKIDFLKTEKTPEMKTS